MEKILDFESYEIYAKLLKKIFDQKIDIENSDLLVYNSLNKLNGTETFLGTYNSIRKDIELNTELLEAVSVLMGSDNQFLRNIEKKNGDQITIDIIGVSIKRNFNNNVFTVEYNGAEELVDRVNLKKYFRAILNDKMFGKNKVFGATSAENLYNTQDKWNYAINYDDRVMFEKMVSNIVEKTKNNLELFAEKINLSEYNSIVEGGTSATVRDTKSDSFTAEKKEIPNKLKKYKHVLTIEEKDFNKIKKELEMMVGITEIDEFFNQDLINGKREIGIVFAKKDETNILKNILTFKGVEHTLMGDNNILIEVKNPKNKELNLELLEEFKNNKHIKTVEFDNGSDLETKIPHLLKQLNSLDIAIQDNYELKIRLLGRHNTNGVFFDGIEGEKLPIVALTEKDSTGTIKVLAQFIDSNTKNINRKEFVNFLYSHGGLKDEKELIGKAAEISYLLNNIGFEKVFDLIEKRDALFENENDEKIAKELRELQKDFDISDEEIDYIEENILNILLKKSETSQNKGSDGLTVDLQKMTDNSVEYLNLNDRNFYEIVKMYNYFASMFKYKELEVEMQNVKTNEVFQRIKGIQNTRVKKPAIEKFGKEEFLNVKNSIEKGYLEGYTLEELVEDGLKLASNKTRIIGLQNFIKQTIMNTDLRIKHKIIDYDTFEYFLNNNKKDLIENIKDFSILLNEKKGYKRDFSINVLEFALQFCPSRIGSILNSTNTDLILDELIEKGKLVDFLNHEKSDSFVGRILIYSENKKEEILNVLFDKINKEELKIDNLKSFLNSNLDNINDKKFSNYYQKSLGISFDKTTNKPTEFTTELLNNIYKNLHKFEEIGQKQKTLKELCLFCKSKDFKFDNNKLDNLEKTTIIALNFSLYTRKSFISKDEMVNLIKSIGPEEFKKNIDIYNSNLTERDKRVFNVEIKESKLESIIQEAEKQIKKEEKNKSKIVTKKEISTITPDPEEDFSDIPQHIIDSFKEEEERFLGLGGN